MTTLWKWVKVVEEAALLARAGVGRARPRQQQQQQQQPPNNTPDPPPWYSERKTGPASLRFTLPQPGALL